MQRLKVEILIPKFYNDKRPVEASKHIMTYREIFREFKGCTKDNSPLVGDWMSDEGKTYSDRNFSYWVICDDNVATTHFLVNLKERLKERYAQKDIMMYSISINVM